MSFRNKVLAICTVSFFSVTALLAWKNYPHQKISFDCRARLHTDYNNGFCDLKSSADIFMSLNKDGAGFIIAAGQWSCKNSPPVTLDVLADFTYRREGNFYFLDLKRKDPGIDVLFSPLKYSEVIMKITDLDSEDSLISLPNQILMVCTDDKPL